MNFLIHLFKHVFCAQKNPLIETVLLSTRNICFGPEIRNYFLIMHLICSSDIYDA